MADGGTVERQIEEAVACLRRGEVVAFPTETFYGLAADARSAAAVERLVSLKGRPQGKPIPCIVGELPQVAQLCVEWPPLAARLAARFWPGPLTLVVPARPELPAPLRPEGTVGLRLSSHPLARALALGLAGPITSTSANLSGGREVSRASDLDPALRPQLGFVLDGGPTPGGLGSTVARIDGDRLTCFRDGAIPFRDLVP